MEYYVYIVSVGDADAIVINYQDDNTRWWTIVIDAGNVGDGEEVKRYIKHIENGCFIIDMLYVLILTKIIRADFLTYIMMRLL